jgi:hypothetical protein
VLLESILGQKSETPNPNYLRRKKRNFFVLVEKIEAGGDNGSFFLGI